jgi:hypothetical protein
MSSSPRIDQAAAEAGARRAQRPAPAAQVTVEAVEPEVPLTPAERRRARQRQAAAARR